MGTRALEASWRQLRAAPVALGSALVILAMALAAVFAPWLAPYTPFDPATLSLANSMLPPAWAESGRLAFPLGTDDQGRDLLSTLMYGGRISLAVGAASVLVSMLIGVSIGLVAGYAGGWFESLSMRIVDVQLTIPSILLALLIDGVLRAWLPREAHAELALYTLVFAIGLAQWPRFARVARSCALVERNREYVQAARIIGVAPGRIVLRHVLPNASAPLLVLATVDLGLAVLTEASLSFLGVGAPPTQPSLGTLIRIGTNFLFSGEWWVFVMPAAMLVVLVLAVNMLGDWLRDQLNPKLRQRR